MKTTINYAQTVFTEITSAKKAYFIVRALKRAGRYKIIIPYKMNNGKKTYYIFYYNYIVK